MLTLSMGTIEKTAGTEERGNARCPRPLIRLRALLDLSGLSEVSLVAGVAGNVGASLCAPMTWGARTRALGLRPVIDTDQGVAVILDAHAISHDDRGMRPRDEGAWRVVCVRATASGAEVCRGVLLDSAGNRRLARTLGDARRTDAQSTRPDWIVVAKFCDRPSVKLAEDTQDAQQMRGAHGAPERP